MPAGPGEEGHPAVHALYRPYQSLYDSVDITLLWTVLVCFGIPPRIFAVLRQFHDGMRACVRLDDVECSDMSDVEQGLRQGCVLVPLLFNIFFTAVLRVLRVAEKRFITADDAIITDSMVQPQRKEKGGEKRGRARAGRVDGQRKEEAAQTLWGMLYADDAGIVSRSRKGWRR